MSIVAALTSTNSDTVYSAAQVAALAIEAGLNQQSAVVATAISLAEDGSGELHKKGDLSLQDSTWGPSYGLWQIRTEKNPTSPQRDINQLQTGAQQAAAMVIISGSGRSWTAWSTYIDGQYLAHMLTATSAVSQAYSTGASASNATAVSWTDPLKDGASKLLNDGSQVLGDVPGAGTVSSLTDELQQIVSFLEDLSDPTKDKAFALRLAKVGIGMTLLIVALVILERDLIGRTVSDVGTVAEVAAVIPK